MLSSHASAEACLTGWPNVQHPREGTSVVLRDTIRLCVVCSCCATSPYREMCRLREGLGVERPCAMIFTLLGLNHCFSGD